MFNWRWTMRKLDRLELWIERVAGRLGFARCAEVYCRRWFRPKDDSGFCSTDCFEVYNSWLCACGHYEDGGCCCTHCDGEPPWGCVGCAIGEMQTELAERDEFLDMWEHYPGELLTENIDSSEEKQ
jgi:hypothetical protein